MIRRGIKATHDFGRPRPNERAIQLPGYRAPVTINPARTFNARSDPCDSSQTRVPPREMKARAGPNVRHGSAGSVGYP